MPCPIVKYEPRCRICCDPVKLTKWQTNRIPSIYPKCNHSPSVSFHLVIILFGLEIVVFVFLIVFSWKFLGSFGEIDLLATSTTTLNDVALIDFVV
ncbi:hypothetical protein EYC84_011548 [Monilinia fructicola]|uniref:Uncharacterized protein n=1 Tax=Monilinia fructicola TaxID=38448 RepID=A0A5M9J754_MONFR|nr:hypothetical protein EYC84_011548 [Monilinia fructicola]